MESEKSQTLIFSGGLLGQLASVGGEFISDQVLLILTLVMSNSSENKMQLLIVKLLSHLPSFAAKTEPASARGARKDWWNHFTVTLISFNKI